MPDRVSKFSQYHSKYDKISIKFSPKQNFPSAQQQCLTGSKPVPNKFKTCSTPLQNQMLFRITALTSINIAEFKFFNSLLKVSLTYFPTSNNLWKFSWKLHCIQNWLHFGIWKFFHNTAIFPNLAFLIVMCKNKEQRDQNHRCWKSYFIKVLLDEQRVITQWTIG